MDAYGFSNKVKELWIMNSPKQSGTWPKNEHMSVVVNTPEGYREVIGVFWNKDINAIEIVTDAE